MKIAYNPDASARVRMRTDGPPVPIHRHEGPPRRQNETFIRMSMRRLPGLLLAVIGAVMLGGLIGKLLIAAT